MLAAVAADAGLRRVHFVAWRDLDDPEAGGSELHAHRIASLWADGRARRHLPNLGRAGPARDGAGRDGYRVVRRSGRYAVFPDAAWEGVRRPATAR